MMWLDSALLPGQTSAYNMHRIATWDILITWNYRITYVTLLMADKHSGVVNATKCIFNRFVFFFFLAMALSWLIVYPVFMCAYSCVALQNHHSRDFVETHIWIQTHDGFARVVLFVFFICILFSTTFRYASNFVLQRKMNISPRTYITDCPLRFWFSLNFIIDQVSVR